MGKYETGDAKSAIIPPRPFSDVKRPPTHDEGSHGNEHFIQKLAVRGAWILEDPVMKTIPTIAERMLDVDTFGGNATIE